jgi:hypothetical protein
VLTNVTELTPEGKIGVIPAEGDGLEWWRKWTHVAEEFQLRFGPYPAGWSKDVLAGFHHPKVDYPPVTPEYLALASQEGLLLKLGKRAHMEAMLEAGQIRIAPASEYGDSSLNPAVHDDELSFESIYPPGTVVMVGPAGESGPPSIPVGGMKIFRSRSTMPTNYFVYCMSTVASPRLFGDFGYDACVVITNVDGFIERVELAVKELLPDFSTGKGRVRYLDPHFDHDRDLSIPGIKHFRFAYQQEYRMAWIPPTARKDLQPFFVNIGSLTDIATLITLPTAIINAAQQEPDG